MTKVAQLKRELARAKKERVFARRCLLGCPEVSGDSMLSCRVIFSSYASVP